MEGRRDARCNREWVWRRPEKRWANLGPIQITNENDKRETKNETIKFNLNIGGTINE